MDDGPEVELPKRTFVDLPLDLQRTMIDYCIANRMTEMRIDDETFVLPHLLQITSRCSNAKCAKVLSSRFFRGTVVNGSLSRVRRCPDCGGKMYISHKTAVLDYYLGERKKKLRGLERFLAPLVEKEQETMGPTIEREGH